MQAAVRCVRRHGADRTRLADVAAEAGVTRPTLYAYFSSRDDILRAAMLAAADDLVDRLNQRIRATQDPARVAIETLIFCLNEVSSNPGLAALLTPTTDLRSAAPLVPRGLNVAKRAVRPIIDRRPDLEPEWDEIAEVMVRFFLSLVTVASPKRRSEVQLREFLRKRLVPALGL